MRVGHRSKMNLSSKATVFIAFLLIGVSTSTAFVFNCTTLLDCDGCKEIEQICDVAFVCESDEKAGKPASQQNCTEYIQDCEDRVTMCLEEINGGMEVVVTTETNRGKVPTLPSGGFFKPPWGGGGSSAGTTSRPNQPSTSTGKPSDGGGSNPTTQADCGRNGASCPGTGDSSSCCPGYSCEASSDLSMPGPPYECVLLIDSPTETTPF